MPFSQYEEEAILLGLLDGCHRKRLLDVGAYDGVTFSNSRQLILDGWTGVLVEPSPINVARLLDLYRWEPRVKVVDAMIDVSTNEPMMVFHDSNGDGISSCNEDHVRRWSEHTKFTPLVKPRTDWYQLLDLKGPVLKNGFDIVMIDTEGTTLQLAVSCPLFDKSGWMHCPPPRVVVLEHSPEPQSDFDRVMASRGYSPHARTKENTIYRIDP